MPGRYKRMVRISINKFCKKRLKLLKIGVLEVIHDLTNHQSTVDSATDISLCTSGLNDRSAHGIRSLVRFSEFIARKTVLRGARPLRVERPTGQHQEALI